MLQEGEFDMLLSMVMMVVSDQAIKGEQFGGNVCKSSLGWYANGIPSGGRIHESGTGGKTEMILIYQMRF